MYTKFSGRKDIVKVFNFVNKKTNEKLRDYLGDEAYSNIKTTFHCNINEAKGLNKNYIKNTIKSMKPIYLDLTTVKFEYIVKLKDMDKYNNSGSIIGLEDVFTYKLKGFNPSTNKIAVSNFESKIEYVLSFILIYFNIHLKETYIGDFIITLNIIIGDNTKVSIDGAE